ncbi:hypothetical protein NLI96_g6699 [Meripilus lineatus]|uniref:CENP-C homolog n=1 Tax=Meripilus lineatus TaxID=2056292 RepID=A0AAD5V5A4_9APHY|nr:hypothetical protein NLI96_g6699 [Physisporinus lineatus]
MDDVQGEKDLHLAPEHRQAKETSRPDAIITEYPGGEEIRKRVAFTTKMANLMPGSKDDFSFQRVFGDGDFVAAGLLVIPPKKSKPTKSTNNSTFVFCVIEGTVNVKIHKTSFVIASGGMFMAPRGNTYFVQNISDRDARLCFVQTRKVVDDKHDEIDSFDFVRLPEVYPEVPSEPDCQTERADPA